MRILILDDNEKAREKLRLALNHIDSDGHTVCGENPASIIEAYQEKHPDLIFIRLGGTVFSGLSTAEALKKLDPFAKIIFVSQTDLYAPYAFQTGASGFLLEPMDGVKLREAVSRSRSAG